MREYLSPEALAQLEARLAELDRRRAELRAIIADPDWGARPEQERVVLLAEAELLDRVRSRLRSALAGRL